MILNCELKHEKRELWVEGHNGTFQIDTKKNLIIINGIEYKIKWHRSDLAKTNKNRLKPIIPYDTVFVHGHTPDGEWVTSGLYRSNIECNNTYELNRWWDNIAEHKELMLGN